MRFDDLDDMEPLPTTDGADVPVLVLIDDDREIRSSVPLALGASFAVRTYASAARGVEAIDSDVSVVLLDIKMPDQDGFAAYEEIREKDPDLPIIFHSAYQNLKDPYTIVNDYRPFGYIVKGSPLEKLTRLLHLAVQQRQRLLRHRRLAQELAEVRAKMEFRAKTSHPRRAK
jgi:two-component system NtrC family response regulator